MNSPLGTIALALGDLEKMRPAEVENVALTVHTMRAQIERYSHIADSLEQRTAELEN